ncbi:MAG TPA: hypothetical protein VE153_38320 [Myxococcus sp.]|nr:hypothetical protein [Myxococcus sp.]
MSLRPRPPPDIDPRLTARTLASGLFFLAALAFGGGALGLTVGVLLDKALRPHAHGFPGLAGLVLGTPAGVLLGLGVGIGWMTRLSARQRYRLGGLTLGVASLCALGLFGAVELGLMRW